MFANEKRTSNTIRARLHLSLCARLPTPISTFSYFTYDQCNIMWLKISTLSLTKVESNEPTIYVLKITLQFSAFIYFIYYHNLWQFNIVGMCLCGVSYFVLVIGFVFVFGLFFYSKYRWNRGQLKLSYSIEQCECMIVTR